MDFAQVPFQSQHVSARDVQDRHAKLSCGVRRRVAGARACDLGLPLRLLLLVVLAVLQTRVLASDHEARSGCVRSLAQEGALTSPRSSHRRTASNQGAAAQAVLRLPPVPAPTPPICDAQTFDPSSKHAFLVPVFSVDVVSSALVLLESARLSCTRAHVIALLDTSLPNVTDNTFLGMGFAVARVLPIRHPVATRHRLYNSKLGAWLLTQYAVIAVLDTDMVVVRNADELFSADGASVDSLSAVADYDTVAPDAGGARGGRAFDSGLMVVRPSVDTFSRLVQAMDSFKSDGDGDGDQGFLNAMFPDWRELPNVYNLDKRVLTSPADAARLQALLFDVKILRFSGEKPWMPYDRQTAALQLGSDDIIPEDYEFAYAPWRAVDEVARFRLHGVLSADMYLHSYLNAASDMMSVGWVLRGDVLRRQYHRPVCIPGRTDPGCYTLFPFLCLGGDIRCAGRPSGAAAERRLRSDAGGVTLVTQCSASKLPRLAALASEWGGPVSAALYVPGGDDALDHAVAQLRTLRLPRTVDIHLVQGDSDKYVYPINLLRTLAQRAARTHLVLLLDVDFVVQRWLFPALQAANPSAAQAEREAARARAQESGFLAPSPASDGRPEMNSTQFDRVWADASCRHVFLLPAFQLNVRAPCDASDAPVLADGAVPAGTNAAASSSVLCVPLPGDKAAITAALGHGWADVFHATLRNAHQPTDVRRWLHTNSSLYYVEWAADYEPYGIINASLPDAPEYDIRFVDRGGNKAIFTHVAQLRGFRFVVLPAPFLVHAWESTEEEKATRRRMQTGRLTLYNEIVISELKKREEVRVAAAYETCRSGKNSSSVCGSGSAAYETPKLPVYGQAIPAAPWEPTAATRSRGSTQRRTNPRLEVPFDAWNNSVEVLALPVLLLNLTHL